MAERRMFAKTIVLSDAFLDLPMSARCLYFTLGMLADDDGFVNAPRSIMRQCGASDDDMKNLLAKKFAILFDSGVIVIKHWRINNYLRNDRYTETKYGREKAELETDENGAYRLTEECGPSRAPAPTSQKEAGIPGGIPGGIPNSGIPNMGIPRLGKDRIDKDSTGQGRVGDRGPGEEGETQDAPTSLTGTSPEGGGGTDDGLTDDRQNLIAVYKNQIGAFRRLGYDPSPIIRKAALDGITPAELGEATG